MQCDGVFSGSDWVISLCSLWACINIYGIYVDVSIPVFDTEFDGVDLIRDERVRRQGKRGNAISEGLLYVTIYL